MPLIPWLLHPSHTIFGCFTPTKWNMHNLHQNLKQFYETTHDFWYYFIFPIYSFSFKYLLINGPFLNIASNYIKYLSNFTVNYKFKINILAEMNKMILKNPILMIYFSKSANKLIYFIHVLANLCIVNNSKIKFPQVANSVICSSTIIPLNNNGFIGRRYGSRFADFTNCSYMSFSTI